MRVAWFMTTTGLNLSCGAFGCVTMAEKQKKCDTETQTSRPEIGWSNCCTNCCTLGAQQPPKTPKNALKPPKFHNNIRKTGSFRNREVISSSPIVGSSTFTWYRFQRFLPKSDDRLLTTTVSNNFSTVLAPSLLQSYLRRFLLALLCYCGPG